MPKYVLLNSRQEDIPFRNGNPLSIHANALRTISAEGPVIIHPDLTNKIEHKG